MERADALVNWDRRTEQAFFGFLAVLLGYLAYFSSVKLFWFDEFLSYYTESSPTTAALLKAQVVSPVSLDPPFYHLLGHWIITLGLNPTFAVRLPALLGTVMMITGVYLFTRRLAGFYAAAISVAGLLLTYDFYLVEARPYGILLGTSALSLLFWQNSIRGQKRVLSLFGLFCVLSLAVSCHYFGILIAVPILLAEAVRAARLRRLDLPVLAAILPSYGFAGFWLPFLKGAGQYKANYYIKPDFLDCIRSYSWLNELHRNAKQLPVAVDLLLFVLVLSTVVAGAYLGYRASRDRTSSPEEWSVLVFLAILPLFGGILSVAGAGSYLPRYVIESGIGFMVPRVAGVLYFFRSNRIRTLALAVFSLLLVVQCYRDHVRDRKDREMLNFCISQTGPEVLVIPDQYDEFMRMYFYFQHHPAASWPYAWVADVDREIAWQGTDNISRTMLNLEQITPLPVISYTDLMKSNRRIEIIQAKSNKRDWLVKELTKNHAGLTLKATKGDFSVYELQLPKSQVQADLEHNPARQSLARFTPSGRSNQVRAANRRRT